MIYPFVMKLAWVGFIDTRTGLRPCVVKNKHYGSHWQLTVRAGFLTRSFRSTLKPSFRYDYPTIPPNIASRPIRDEER